MKTVKTKRERLEEICELFGEKTGIALTLAEMERVIIFAVENYGECVITAAAYGIKSPCAPAAPCASAENACAPAQNPPETTPQAEKTENVENLCKTPQNSDEIAAAFKRVEDEIIEMWGQIRGCESNYKSANQEISRINKLYEWNSGNWTPQERETPDSNFSVEVLALIDNGLGGEYHAVLQYDFDEKAWVDEDNIKVRPPKCWQYIYDKAEKPEEKDGIKND